MAALPLFVTWLNRYIAKNNIRPVIDDPNSLLTIHVLRITLLLQSPPEPAEWIEKFVYDAFLQRNDPIIRDLDIFGANLGATFGDVAVTDSVRIPQFFDAICGIERVHLQSGDMD
jgi:hypothetical protein